MATIGFLGLGAMGARMAANLLKAGHQVSVWNRDPGRAAPLAALGAAVAKNPRAAAQGAEFVIAMLRDDDASRQVWLAPDMGAAAGLAGGAVAIECSTLTFAHVRALAAACAQKGAAFLDAPVAGSRPQAEAAQLIFMAGGDAAAFAAAEPVLRAMGAVAHHAGGAGAGAAAKLLVNSLFATQLAALGEWIALARKMPVDPARLIEVFAATPVCSPAAKGAAAAMLAGQFAPMFPIGLVAKDMGYVALAARDAGAQTPIADSVAEIYALAAAGGLADDNITAIVRRFG